MGMRRRFVLLGAAVLALAGCWPVPGQNADHTAFNPIEAGLTPATVGDLTQAWSVALGPPGRPLSAPIVSATGVHVVVDGCAFHTLRPEDGSTVWARATTPGTGACDSTIRQFLVIFYTPPYVVGDRVL
jgi:hypothetical protein